MRWTLSIKYGLQSINFWEFWFPKKSIFSNWFLKQISISGDQSFHSKINIKIQKNQYNNQNKMKFKNQYPINHTNFQICMGSVAAPCFPCRISGFILFTHDLFQGVVSCWSYVHMTFFKVLGLADPMYTSSCKPQPSWANPRNDTFFKEQQSWVQSPCFQGFGKWPFSRKLGGMLHSLSQGLQCPNFRIWFQVMCGHLSIWEVAVDPFFKVSLSSWIKADNSLPSFKAKLKSPYLWNCPVTLRGQR